MSKNDTRKFIEAVGAKARTIRIKNELTLEEVEGNGYPSWRHLQKVESGTKNITLSTVLNLARALDVEPWELLKIDKTK